MAIIARQAPSAGEPVTRVRSQEDLRALEVKRTELESQLKSITDRRERLAVQRTLSRTKAASDELDVRIAGLDERAARLERELTQTSDAIVEALPYVVADRARQEAIATLPPPPGMLDSNAQMLRNLVVIEGASMVLLAFVFWRAIKRYAGGSRQIGDVSPRLTQLQQSVDVIALEVERISEAQRFLSKAMNEKLPVAAGEAQSVPAPK
jgi:hypothetical protein